MLLDSVNTVAAVLGIALAPAAAGLVLTRRSLGKAAIGLSLAAGAVVVIAALGERPYAPFTPGELWSFDELGAAKSFLPGWSPVTAPVIVTLAATAVAWAAFSLGAGSALRRAPAAAGTSLLWWTTGGLLLMTALLWLTYDRYLLPFVPPALALVLGRGAQVSWRRAAVPVVAMLAISVTGTRDHLELQRVTWAAVDALRASNVPVSHIDGGYVVNGWLQYAHPEQAARDAEGRVAVPMVNGGRDLPWVVGLGVLPGTRVSREFDYGNSWGHPGRVLILERP
jgi:hypothetical protein